MFAMVGWGGDAENAGLENGLSRPGIWRTKERGWKTQDWKVME